jgi:Tol biopolymer transport system component
MGWFCGLPTLGPFSDWSAPVSLGSPVNTSDEDSAPTVSADERSLYINRNVGGQEDLFVSQRRNPHQPWGEAMPIAGLNTTDFHERNATLSRDGSLLFFSSNREPGGSGGLDLYVSHRVRKNKHTVDAWGPPTNLGALVNSASDDVGPGYFEDGRGNDFLYFTSNRPGGPGLFDLYLSVRGHDGTFGAPVVVSELSSAANDARPAVRADGLEIVFQSNRAPTAGLADLWVSTRSSLSQPWGAPVSLTSVNTALQDRQAALSNDGETLYFASTRPSGGPDDIWTSTRVRL